jgi:hypothetical protein
MSNSPRVLLYDIETSHNIVAQFDPKDEYTPHTNILVERFIICACWQWLGETKIHTVAITDDSKRFAKDKYDDYRVVKTLHEVIGKADVLVGHNSIRFDDKFVNTRALYHGLSPLPPTTSIDTYKIAKLKFRLNSNRLDYLGTFLGFGGKKHTPPGLWIDVLKGDKKAIKTMVDYNKHDVVLLRKVFEKLSPYAPNYINRELFGGTGCPRCGGHKVQSRGYHRAISRVYQRFCCTSCGGWFRSVVNDKSVKTTSRTL